MDDGKIVDSGTVSKEKIKDGNERIAEMSESLCAIVDKVKPELVVIENIQNQNSTKTVILLARLQGMILGYCHAHSIRTEILEPSKWRSKLSFKQGAGVKRDALKQQAVDYIKAHYNMDVDIDQSEAICIAVVANKMFGMSWDD